VKIFKLANINSRCIQNLYTSYIWTLPVSQLSWKKTLIFCYKLEKNLNFLLQILYPCWKCFKKKCENDLISTIGKLIWFESTKKQFLNRLKTKLTTKLTFPTCSKKLRFFSNSTEILVVSIYSLCINFVYICC
jgi:hypothetical protein